MIVFGPKQSWRSITSVKSHVCRNNQETRNRSTRSSILMGLSPCDHWPSPWLLVIAGAELSGHPLHAVSTGSNLILHGLQHRCRNSELQRLINWSGCAVRTADILWDQQLANRRRLPQETVNHLNKVSSEMSSSVCLDMTAITIPRRGCLLTSRFDVLGTPHPIPVA